MTPSRLENLTLEAYEREFSDRHLLHGVVAHWARLKPHAPAFIIHERGLCVDWQTLEERSLAHSRRLLRLGFRKGDFLATSLPFTAEHIFLEYACFRIGVIHTPLDLRMRPAEVARALNLIAAKGYVHLGAVPPEVSEACSSVEHWLASGADIPALVSESELRAAEKRVEEDDGAQVIFTTGSTGSPKPALLSHRSITSQNFCLGGAFEFRERRFLLNLPPSHVGGQAEILMTALFYGGTAVILEAFDAARSLAAIAEHGIELIGQIPAMFHFEWRQPDYAAYDLSSLTAAIFGGQGVPRAFLEKMLTMAPRIGTGLGLTEASGFCTYTPVSGDIGDVDGTLGHAAPLYPMTIRHAMRHDGAAGDEMAPGEVGHVCFRGPQTFPGYVNNTEATAQAISRDGWLYTGDMGSVDSRGLKLAGRTRWIIKPAGYQVFPGDVEAHLAAFDGVAQVGVVGAEHRTLMEAVVAFIEPRPGVEIDLAALRRHARGMASYMRPLHYVVLDPGQMPLNRVAKIDYLLLSAQAKDEIARLRALGRWDN